MQVNAINSLNTNFKGRINDNDYREEDSQENKFKEDEHVSMRNSRAARAMRNTAMATLIGLGSLGAASSLQSCEADATAEAYASAYVKLPDGLCKKGDTIYIKEYVPGETVYKHDTIVNEVPIYLPGDTVIKHDTTYVDKPGKTDTIYIDRPGKTDTIYVDRPGKTDTIIVDRPVVVTDTIYKHDTTYVDKPIYIPGDTVYMRPDFKSDVADTINKYLGDLDVPPEGLGIPISMVYYDEYETMANKLLFNGEESSKNRLIYDETKKGWYGDQHYMRVEFSLNAGSGLGLIMRVKKSRTDGTKPVSDLDWVDFKTYLFRNNGKGQLIKYEVNDGIAKEIGIVRQGDKPKSVLNDYTLSNGETQTLRYSDINVKNHNLKYDQLYKEYLDKLAESQGE